MASLPDHLAPLPVGTARIPQEVLEEHQREKAMAAAVRVFAEHGFQRTTVDDIVAAAKIGVGSFYSLFEGKEDCFLQAYGSVIEQARSRIEAAVPAGAEWPTQAHAALLAGLRWIDTEPDQARLTIAVAQTAGPPSLERYKTLGDELVAFLSRGRAVSPFADQIPARQEQAIVGGLAWFLQSRLAGRSFKGAEKLLPGALEIVVEPYVGPKALAEVG